MGGTNHQTMGVSAERSCSSRPHLMDTSKNSCSPPVAGAHSAPTSDLYIAHYGCLILFISISKSISIGLSFLIPVLPFVFIQCIYIKLCMCIYIYTYVHMCMSHHLSNYYSSQDVTMAQKCSRKKTSHLFSDPHLGSMLTGDPFVGEDPHMNNPHSCRRLSSSGDSP